MSEPVDRIDPDEPPLFDLDAMHEPDHDVTEGERGDTIILEGVTIPFDVAQYGNGRLPDSVLQRIGIQSHRLHPAAAAGFATLRSLASGAGIDLTCTDSYRSLDNQIDLKKRKPDWSATPGRSVHGWGFAVDLSIGMPQKPFGMSVLQWLEENGPPNGWFKGRPKDEPWHWVFRGAGGAASASGMATAEAAQAAADAAGASVDPADVAAMAGDAEVAAGASGPGVKIARALLGLPEGDSFDDATDAAVRAFQQANQLAVDGKVGPRTWAVLRSVTAPADRPDLARDSTGDAVKWVQCRVGARPDGTFGERTEARVCAFQQARGLVVDGKVGPQTWQALTT